MTLNTQLAHHCGCQKDESKQSEAMASIDHPFNKCKWRMVNQMDGTRRRTKVTDCASRNCKWSIAYKGLNQGA
ncbi:hypothetical protein BDY17DRAFT_297313 [Neohortaea acidophila]|uniref:Uncharacterized protein n=1 Tax=Neohortaea acidophila TaxID=245834 RepID=A0A6A6PUB3_9PEZI|nr:uncharacterized protein BDY17DRAFT_297313 [Neohortaea acidophila]KAF2483356.1 hypothetical protein BDY17DRAFT_297313 [Neohortaea acidophila]